MEPHRPKFGLRHRRPGQVCSISDPIMEQAGPGQYLPCVPTRHTILHFEYQGLIACIDIVEVNNWTRLVFPVLRSFAVLCHDDMVPLLQLMIILALDYRISDYPDRAYP